MGGVKRGMIFKGLLSVHPENPNGAADVIPFVSAAPLCGFENGLTNLGVIPCQT